MDFVNAAGWFFLPERSLRPGSQARFCDKGLPMRERKVATTVCPSNVFRRVPMCLSPCSFPGLISAAIVGLAVFLTPQTLSGDELWQNFDDGDTSWWVPQAGAWTVQNGAYVQTDKSGPNYRYTLLNFPLNDGYIEFDATVLEKNTWTSPFGSFGVIWKYIDGNNYGRSRFGSYRQADALEYADGQEHEMSLGAFQPELGRTYHVKAVLDSSSNTVSVILDGVVRVVLRDLLPGRVGRFGLFTESHTKFDNVHAVRNDGLSAALLVSLTPQTESVILDGVVRVGRFGLFTESHTKFDNVHVVRNGGLSSPSIVSLTAGEGTYVETFDADVRWADLNGNWDVIDGAMRQTGTYWGRMKVVASKWIVDGTIRFTAMVDPDAQPAAWNCLGVVVKWISSEQYIYIRIGAYGGVYMFAQDGENEYEQHMGGLTPVPGRWYVVEAAVAGDQVSLSIDGVSYGTATVPLSGVAGRIGFYTENVSAFDDLTVTGVEDRPEEPPFPTGTAEYAVEFATYRADVPNDLEAFSVHGTLNLYVRNPGDGAAILDRLTYDGQTPEQLLQTGRISWYRQRPYWIAPGEVGEISIRFNGISESQCQAFRANPFQMLNVPTEITAQNGVSLNTTTALSTRMEPMQINFVAFSTDLRTIYVYVQNNRKVLYGDGLRFALSTVEVNGEDVTSRTTFGETRIYDDVVPLEIRLDSSLLYGREVVITISTVEGVRCGYTCRAVPSEFHVWVWIASNQVRNDYLRDIYNHCISAVGGAVSDPDNILGMDLIPFGNRNNMERVYFMPHEYVTPGIKAVWIDEVDKGEVVPLWQRWSESIEFSALDGTTYPLQVFNIMQPWSSVGIAFGELGEGVVHEYGIGGGPAAGRNGEDFPLTSSLGWREYRVARRPFWPYFRCGELAMFVDDRYPALNPNTQRVIDPREERFILYGTLMLGAKGFFHWLYGASYSETGEYYVDGPQLRISLGGVPANRMVAGFEVPKEYYDALMATWDEVGRVAAEVRSIGPRLARSDVSYRARIVSSNPDTAPNGGPAVEASALVSGVDTIILVVLNLNIDSTWSWQSPIGVRSYQPIDTTVAVKVPSWLTPVDTFTVDIDTGVQDITGTTAGDELRFTLNGLAVQKIIVITSDPEMRGRVEQELRGFRDRLHLINGTVLPYSEDFEDGFADFLEVQSGNWQVNAGSYETTPTVGTDAVSLLKLADPLPPDVSVAATISSLPGSRGYYSNAVVIFDYQSPTNFKYAGGFMGTDYWRIGHVEGGSWVHDESVPQRLISMTDYDIEVLLNGSTVTLLAGGQVKATFDFGESLTDGAVGLGTHNAVSKFDIFEVKVPPPTVVDVLVSSTAWAGSFLTELGSTGYSIPVGSGDQLLALPWIDIDQIRIVFNKHVVIQESDLSLLGVNVPTYTFTDFSYDSGTFTATWTLANPIDVDKLLIVLSDTIQDQAGSSLDGEWTDGSSMYPSGDGVAGGAFQFRFNVLPADVNQDATVLGNDVILTRNAQFTFPGDGGYSIFYDVDGSGSILGNDVINVRNHQFTSLPSGDPTLP